MKDNIIASLTYGRLWKKMIIFWWICLGFGLFFLGFSFGFLFPETDWTGFITVFSFGMLFTILALVFLIKDFSLNKKCKKWLQDAILLKAKTSGRQHPFHFMALNYGRTKLEITFYYNGKKIKKESGTKTTNGYDIIFTRFLDREINILYSPVFDEVMLLKDD